MDVMQSQEITSENKEEEQKRQQFTDSAFGSNPQPVLERVEFKVCIEMQFVYIQIKLTSNEIGRFLLYESLFPSVIFSK